MKRLFRFLIALACGGVFVATANAQLNNGGIAGTITDSTGNVVAKAAISAVNTATRGTTTTTSTSAGDYRLGLPVGTYQLTVTAPGFQRAQRSGVIIQIDTTSTLNISLVVGSTSETVEVTADAPQLETNSSDVGTVVTPRQVVDLPLPVSGSAIRNASNFVFLTPATFGTGTAGGSTQAGVGGGQTQGSQFMLDGLSLQLQSFGDWFETNELPSVEAIGEFKVLIAGVPATEGRSTSGSQSYTTKSGSNSWHGGGFDIIHRTAFDANTWFNNLSIARNGRTISNVTPADDKSEFGLSLGGGG